MSTRETFDYECQACEHLFNEDEAGGPAYECSRCGTEFTRDSSADGDSNRCPNCNIFGAKIADLTCPECESADVEEGEFEPPPPPTEEELVEQAAKQAESERHTRQIMAEHAVRRQAQREAWEALGDWWAAVDEPGGKLDHATYSFKEGSVGSDLPLDLAEKIAATLLDTPFPPPLPGRFDSDADYDAARAAQRGRWTLDGFARAFAGIDNQGTDLAVLLADGFGGEFGAVGIGITEPAYRGIAEKLVAKQRRS